MEELFKEIFKGTTIKDVIGCALFITIMFTAIALVEILL